LQRLRASDSADVPAYPRRARKRRDSRLGLKQAQKVKPTIAYTRSRDDQLQQGKPMRVAMTDAIKKPDQRMTTRIVAQTGWNARKTKALMRWKRDASEYSKFWQKKSGNRGSSENEKRDGEQKGGRMEGIK
jgi:hypothetical protein